MRPLILPSSLPPYLGIVSPEATPAEVLPGHTPRSTNVPGADAAGINSDRLEDGLVPNETPVANNNNEASSTIPSQNHGLFSNWSQNQAAPDCASPRTPILSMR